MFEELGMLVCSNEVGLLLDMLFMGKSSVTFGRHSSVDVHVMNMVEDDLPDCEKNALVLSLSRIHCELAIRQGQLQIRDRSTRNETYVNNHRVPAGKWERLKDDDVVSLGGPNPMLKYNATSPSLNPFTFTVVNSVEFLANRADQGVPSNPSRNDRLPDSQTQRKTRAYSGTKSNDSQTQANLLPIPDPEAAEIIDLTTVISPHPKAQQPLPELAEREEGGNKRSRLERQGMPAPPEETAPAPDSRPCPEQPISTFEGATQFINGIKEQFVCPICQELVVAAHAVVPCGHCFCGSCLAQWLSRGKRECPTCRMRTSAPPVRQNAMDNAVQALAAQISADDRKAIKEKKEEWERGKDKFQRQLQGDRIERHLPPTCNFADFLHPFSPDGAGMGFFGQSLLSGIHQPPRPSRRRSRRSTRDPPPSSAVDVAMPSLTAAGRATPRMTYKIEPGSVFSPCCDRCRGSTINQPVLLKQTGNTGPTVAFIHIGCVPQSTWLDVADHGGVRDLSRLPSQLSARVRSAIASARLNRQSIQPIVQQRRR